MRAAALPLDAIDDSQTEGSILRKTARHILDFLGEREAQAITAEHTAESQRILAGTRFNGDGINQTLSERFFEAAEAYLALREAGSVQRSVFRSAPT